MYYIPQKYQSIGFHSETPSLKAPTNLTFDGYSAQDHAFGCSNCTQTFFLTFCWPCISVYLSQYLNNLIHKICFTISFISCLYMFRAYVLIIRKSKFPWGQNTCGRRIPWKKSIPRRKENNNCSPVSTIPRRKETLYNKDHDLNTCGSKACDDTRGCVMQFWPLDDEHMCSKHVEAWNKTYCETNFVYQVG